MRVAVGRDGSSRFVYSDAGAALARRVGRVVIARASHVEPYPDGRWYADMSPVRLGVLLGPFDTRAEALEKEVAWLLENGIPRPCSTS